MNLRIPTFLALVVSAVAAFGQSNEPPTTPVLVRTPSSTATLTLGDPPPEIMTATGSALPVASTLLPVTPPPPFTFVRGTHLQIVMPTDGAMDPQVTWYKDGVQIGQGGLTWDIAATTAADSGAYSATLYDGTTVVRTSGSAAVRITDTGAPLANYSTRAVISASQPFILGGFVVQHGPAQAMVLVRAVGPALAQFGVANPLPAPRLEVRDADGHAVSPWEFGTVVVVSPSGQVLPDSRVGEFPLPAGGKDVQHVYLLPPGAYTAKVSSADGAGGTVLLEVYQMPL